MSFWLQTPTATCFEDSRASVVNIDAGQHRLAKGQRLICHPNRQSTLSAKRVRHQNGTKPRPILRAKYGARAMKRRFAVCLFQWAYLFFTHWGTALGPTPKMRSWSITMQRRCSISAQVCRQRLSGAWTVAWTGRCAPGPRSHMTRGAWPQSGNGGSPWTRAVYCGAQAISGHIRWWCQTPRRPSLARRAV